MDRETIIRLAREAQGHAYTNRFAKDEPAFAFGIERLECFVSLVLRRAGAGTAAAAAPACLAFALDFLGDPEASELRTYIERLQRERDEAQATAQLLIADEDLTDSILKHAHDQISELDFELKDAERERDALKARAQQPVPAHIVRDAQRAIAAAERPEGMSTHDGKAVIPASHLRYLLAAATGATGGV